jgi:hypothetical protein
MGLWPLGSEAANPEVLKPHAPPAQIEEARSWKNPFSGTPDNIQKGKTIFHGKAYSMTCHGKDGKGLGVITGLTRKLPRNFKDKDWQSGRMNGELLMAIEKWKFWNSHGFFYPSSLN